MTYSPRAMVSIPFRSIVSGIVQSRISYNSPLKSLSGLHWRLSVSRFPRLYVTLTHTQYFVTDEYARQIARRTTPFGYRRPHGLFQCVLDQLAMISPSISSSNRMNGIDILRTRSITPIPPKSKILQWG